MRYEFEKDGATVASVLWEGPGQVSVETDDPSTRAAGRPLPVVRGHVPDRLRRGRPAEPPARLDPVGVRAGLSQPGPAPRRHREAGPDRPGRGPRAGSGRGMKSASGAQALFKALEGEDVDIVFGIPGGAILPAYDPLLDSSVRHVLCRHEQGAGHAAEGYAWATGKVGVAMATSGPGGCNLVTALADAKMDSVPIVAITGQVPTPVVGNDAFQEADITGITMPVTKHNFLVTDPGEVARDDPRGVPHRPHRPARPGPRRPPEGRPRQRDHVELARPGGPPRLQADDQGQHAPGRRGDQADPRGQAARSSTSAAASSRPNATEELFELATIGHLPVVTTLMARGAFPDAHELCLGMPGMHGVYTAVTAMQKADLLVALGARFDDRVTGKLVGFAPDAKIVHVDIDPAEIGKNRVADVPIVGDCKDVTAQAPRRADEAPGRGRRSRTASAWLAQLAEWQERVPAPLRPAGRRPAEAAVRDPALREPSAGDTIVVSGVGQHQMWASQFWKFNKPRTWINSGGLGTMGFAVPAALGAAAGQPDERVIAIDGDGCFQMTCAGARDLDHREDPVHHGDHQQRLPRHGPPVAGALLRGAVLAGVPGLRHARLREARRGLRRRRPARRAPRRGRHGDREGAVGRRPQRRDRLPRGREGDVLPDGPGGRQQRRHHHRPRGPQAPGRSGGGTDRMTCTRSRSWSRTSPASSRGSRACSPREGSTSTRSRSVPPRAEGLSRMTIVVNVDSKPLEQVTKQLNKLINVIKILEHESGTAVERELMLAKVRAKGDARARIMEIAEVFRVSIVDVTKTTLTVEASGKPEKLEALLRAPVRDYGIVELSRTGRIALVPRGPRHPGEGGLQVAKAAGAEDARVDRRRASSEPTDPTEGLATGRGRTMATIYYEQDTDAPRWRARRSRSSGSGRRATRMRRT